MVTGIIIAEKMNPIIIKSEKTHQAKCNIILNLKALNITIIIIAKMLKRASAKTTEKYIINPLIILLIKSSP